MAADLLATSSSSSSSSSVSGPHQIFLSHSGSQKGFVSDLYRCLSRCGYSVFFDTQHHSLSPGYHFPAQIKAAAHSCKLSIVVLSEEFLTTPWPMRELCAFVGRCRSLDPAVPRVTILPLFYETSPEDLKDKQKLQIWRRMWKQWEDQPSNTGTSTGRMSCSESECEAAVKLLTSRKGVVRHSKREEGEARYIECVMEAVGEILPAFSPLRSPFQDPNKFRVGKQRLCQVRNTVLERY
jgi:hypothetical protein